MIDFAESHLVTLVAGAVVASSLLAFASFEGEQADIFAVQGAIDGLALEIASAACSPQRPAATVRLEAFRSSLPEAIVEVTLLPDRVRAVGEDGAALSSVQFPVLRLVSPLPLMQGRGLSFEYDFLDEFCVVRVL